MSLLLDAQNDYQKHQKPKSAWLQHALCRYRRQYTCITYYRT